MGGTTPAWNLTRMHSLNAALCIVQALGMPDCDEL